VSGIKLADLLRGMTQLTSLTLYQAASLARTEMEAGLVAALPPAESLQPAAAYGCGPLRQDLRRAASWAGSLRAAWTCREALRIQLTPWVQTGVACAAAHHAERQGTS
jgi:hypothetical protein